METVTSNPNGYAYMLFICRSWFYGGKQNDYQPTARYFYMAQWLAGLDDSSPPVSQAMPDDCRMLADYCATLYYMGTIEEHSKSESVEFSKRKVTPCLSEINATTKRKHKLWITPQNSACSCPAFQYRNAGHSTCKHIIALSRAYLEHEGYFKCMKTK